MARIWPVLLVWLLVLLPARAETPTQALLHFIPEETRVLGFCDVERLRTADLFPQGTFELWLRRIYAEQILGQTEGVAPALPCRRVEAAVLAAPKAAPGGVVLIRCVGLDRVQLAKDLERQANVKKIEPAEIPGLVVYHRTAKKQADPEWLGLLGFKIDWPREMWLAALDEQTLVLSTRDASDIVRAARLAKTPVAGVLHASLKPALARLDLTGDLAGLAIAGEVLPTDPVWVVPASLKPLFQRLDYLAVSVRGTDPVRARIFAQTEKAAGGEDLRKCLRDQLTHWRSKADIGRWVLAAYGLGRATGAIDQLPEMVREIGEATRLGMELLGRVEVRGEEREVEVRLKAEASEVEAFLKIARPHLPPAR